MEQSLVDTGDGEKLIDTNVGGVRTTESRLQPSQVCLLAHDIGVSLPVMQ